MIFAITLTGCAPSEEEAREAVSNAGYYDIQINGVDFFSCSQEDMWGRDFKAKNANGKQVEGVVCCGVMKGCTIRF